MGGKLGKQHTYVVSGAAAKGRPGEAEVVARRDSVASEQYSGCHKSKD